MTPSRWYSFFCTARAILVSAIGGPIAYACIVVVSLIVVGLYREIFVSSPDTTGAMVVPLGMMLLVGAAMVGWVWALPISILGAVTFELASRHIGRRRSVATYVGLLYGGISGVAMFFIFSSRVDIVGVFLGAACLPAGAAMGFLYWRMTQPRVPFDFLE